jgi:hypothetical protein
MLFCRQFQAIIRALLFISPLEKGAQRRLLSRQIWQPKMKLQLRPGSRRSRNRVGQTAIHDWSKRWASQEHKGAVNKPLHSLLAGGEVSVKQGDLRLAAITPLSGLLLRYLNVSCAGVPPPFRLNSELWWHPGQHLETIQGPGLLASCFPPVSACTGVHTVNRSVPIGRCRPCTEISATVCLCQFSRYCDHSVNRSTGLVQPPRLQFPLLPVDCPTFSAGGAVIRELTSQSTEPPPGLNSPDRPRS